MKSNYCDMAGNMFTLWCLVIAQAFRVVYVLLLPCFRFICKNNVEDNSYITKDCKFPRTIVDLNVRCLVAATPF